MISNHEEGRFMQFCLYVIALRFTKISLFYREIFVFKFIS